MMQVAEKTKLMNLDEFNRRMEEKGWAIFERFVPDSLIKRMLIDMEIGVKICRDMQVKNGIGDITEGTVHHLISIPECRSSFMEYLELSEALDPYYESYFRGKYILNSYGGNVLFRAKSYANNIHRDIRSYSGDLPLILNTLVMFDDFTKENGATYLMPRSHKTHPDKPTDQEFYAIAEQTTAPAGSVLVFNSNVWHAAGNNNSDKPRRSVTPMYSKPFIKQQFDYPRSLGYDNGDKFSPFMRQILGYNSRVPATLNEWYQPPEKRMYRPGQG